MKSHLLKILPILAASIALVGCETAQGTGTLVGAASGAGLGAIAGNNIHGINKTEGALFGAAVGGLAGNLYGRQQDQINAMDARVNTTTVYVRNRNGSESPVTLRRAQGDTWVGPRGEYYRGVPSSGQLRDAGYGF